MMQFTLTRHVCVYACTAGSLQSPVMKFHVLLWFRSSAVKLLLGDHWFLPYRQFQNVCVGKEEWWEREREERKGCTLEAEKNCNKTVSAMKTCLNWPWPLFFPSWNFSFSVQGLIFPHAFYKFMMAFLRSSIHDQWFIFNTTNRHSFHTVISMRGH